MLDTCLSYILRSSQQAMGFDLSINLYGLIDHNLDLTRHLTF